MTQTDPLHDKLLALASYEKICDYCDRCYCTPDGHPGCGCDTCGGIGVIFPFRKATTWTCHVPHKDPVGCRRCNGTNYYLRSSDAEIGWLLLEALCQGNKGFLISSSHAQALGVSKAHDGTADSMLAALADALTEAVGQEGG